MTQTALEARSGRKNKGVLSTPSTASIDKDELIWPGWRISFSDLLEKNREIRARMQRINQFVRDGSIAPVDTRIGTRVNDLALEFAANHLNEYLISAQAFKNTSEGELIIAYILDPAFYAITAQMLFRLFDSNGHQIQHFFTREFHHLFGFKAGLPGQRVELEEAPIPLIQVYGVPSMYLREIDSVEAGLILF